LPQTRFALCKVSKSRKSDTNFERIVSTLVRSHLVKMVVASLTQSLESEAVSAERGAMHELDKGVEVAFTDLFMSYDCFQRALRPIDVANRQ